MIISLPNGEYALDHGDNPIPERISRQSTAELYEELAFGAASDVQFIHRELERRESLSAKESK